jgi:hypothetical protein
MTRIAKFLTRFWLLVVLFLSVNCFAQFPFSGVTWSKTSASFNYGDLFLYVNAASANKTNGSNNDVVTNLFDWGTNQWTLSYLTSQQARWRNDGGLSNSLPYVYQTNAGPVGVDGGIGLPAQWMASDDTNWTIIEVALAEPLGAGGGETWFYGEDGSSGSSSAYCQNQSVWKINLGNTAGVQATSVEVAESTTNRWMIYTFQNSAGMSTIWTNNVQLATAGPGLTRAIGYATSSSRPRFFGAQYSGAAYWIGAWNRVMMWKYALSSGDRTKYYNQLKTELGLTGLP